MTATDLRAAQQHYFHQVKADDKPGARTAVLRLLDAGTPIEQVVDQVLRPTQVEVGALWERGAWSVVDAHAATEITAATLKAMSLATRTQTHTATRHTVVACADGERHTLPAHMTAAVADAGVSRVTVLGPELPAHAFESVLAQGDVDMLALSCTMPSNLVGAATRIEAAHRFNIPVLVGGRAFGSDMLRAHALGADGWAPRPSALLWPIPRLAGRQTKIPLQALRLGRLDADTLNVARKRAMAGCRGSSRGPVQDVAIPDNLMLLARSTAAAMITDDITILDGDIAWLGRLRGCSPVMSVTIALALAEAIWARIPLGSTLLHDSVARLAGNNAAHLLS